MFHLSYTKKYEGEVKHLKLKRDPWRFGLGFYEDENGLSWDIGAIIGKIICARPVDNCPKYLTYTESCYKGYSITYIPYSFSVI